MTNPESPKGRPPTPRPFDPLVGSVLGDRYEIIRRIGEGGMSAVYEARHKILGKTVAVKVLLEKFLERTELVARLLQEARLASAIGHEHIVDVMDFGTTVDGRSFVVMEHLEGESLAQVLVREAPLGVDRCLGLVRQIVSALGAAHAKGIVHRDVKPENVFMVRRGDQDFVKVLDFGVSKAVRTREEGVEQMRLTRTGMVLGTPLYMSPEQARGDEDVDGRADVWAVGVLMYECLTGEVPFRARNYLAVISQVLTESVEAPSRLRPELEISPAVEAVVMRAIEKDRNQRYATMQDLEKDLERLLSGDPNVGAPIAAPLEPLLVAPQRFRWPLGLAAVLVISAGLAVALSRRDAVPVRSAAVAPPAPQLKSVAPPPVPVAKPDPASESVAAQEPVGAPGDSRPARADLPRRGATRPSVRAADDSEPSPRASDPVPSPLLGAPARGLDRLPSAREFDRQRPATPSQP